MTKLTTVSRLAYLVAASVALVAGVNIANAKNNHHDANAENNGASPHFVVTGQPANEKRVLHEKKKKEKSVTRTKQCLYITSDGKRCGTDRTTGKTPPANGTTGTVGKDPTSGKTVTISNGVTTYTVPFDPKFSVEVAQPGSITVHVGDRTVTLPGGSITVHGQVASTFAADRAGLQEIVNSHGDAVFAIKPQPQSQPPTQLVPTKDGSGGGVVGGVVGVGKAIGNGIEDIGLGFINLGGPTPQPKTSTTIQE
jgi:hypothetical protein